MSKRWLPVIVPLFTLSLWLANPAVADKLRIATEGTYPPFSYVNDSGELTGFDVDIAYALCEVLARDCEVEAVLWTELLDRLEAGEYDMIVASMANTEERAKRVDFTDYYYRSHSIFAGRADIKDTSPEDLAGKTLAAGRDTIQADFLAQHYPDSHILLTDNLPQAFQMLLDGQVDLMLSDTTNLLDLLQRPEAEGFDFVGEPISSPDLQSKAHIAVGKGDNELRRALNMALEKLRLNGIYDRINRKYFPFSIY
ncbi:transporter substrate-binding domain-containing protein [Marinobacterium sp. D7]|uniref:transporter substrate-binding domain-containing protein n=1 Tax=Marinobacterium ramblicola TaxID=2849041 RepID=UPI001C2D3609|nr:transporter substrate-binding domain-containing protein [Marinobacterium ramblicola]MBV1787257.1 transporter substrate-binding domain-containing protein [Marinobacterium ramblicola]